MANSNVRLGYVIVYVRSVAETIAFYEEAFGLKRRFVHESGTYAELETGSTALAFADETFTPSKAVIVPNRPEARAAAAEVGLIVEDVAWAHTQALKAGAVDVVQPTVKPWGQTIAYVRDLNGFLVELCTEVTG